MTHEEGGIDKVTTCDICGCLVAADKFFTHSNWHDYQSER